MLLLILPLFAATAQRYTPDTLTVTINFRQGYSTLDLNYMGNREALANFARTYNSRPHTPVTIHIIGYASPEGTVAINQRLSHKRAAVITNYLRDSCNIVADTVVSTPIGVDWQDLLTAVLADTNVPGREKVLDIITNVTDIVKDSRGVAVSQRNQLLKRVENGRAWSYMLRNIYPNLRGAKAEVMCVIELPEEPVLPPAPAEPSSPIVIRDTIPAEPEPEPVPEPRYARYPIMAARSNLLLPLLNVGLEVPLSKHWSVGADYYYPWIWPAKSNKNCFELIFVSAEARYWFNPDSGELPGKNYLSGHSVAAYGAWGYYDFEHNYHGHQGDVWSAGLDYVYALPIAKNRLRLEFQVGVGAIWSPKSQPYNVFERGGHLIREKDRHTNFFYLGPTKVGVSLVLPINRKVKLTHPLPL